MAIRPVFLSSDEYPYTSEKNIEFTYYSGFSIKQKQKSFLSLHENFKKDFPQRNILEISSKSNIPLGVSLSAFNLKIATKSSSFSVENAFQSSKVFENGGPYQDLLTVTPKEAKKDPRLKNSGKLIAFKYFKTEYPLFPKDYFYNWLYINTLYRNNDLAKEILLYNAFTDIEFNPQKSINCQAKAASIFVSLSNVNLLDKALNSHTNFLEIVYSRPKDKHYHQLSLNLEAK